MSILRNSLRVLAHGSLQHPIASGETTTSMHIVRYRLYSISAPGPSHTITSSRKLQKPCKRQTEEKKKKKRKCKPAKVRDIAIDITHLTNPAFELLTSANFQSKRFEANIAKKTSRRPLYAGLPQLNLDDYRFDLSE
ncbi:hypothetical protein CERZMDRAFT_91805 [Cercospora zeae-maydis SCOH1-5]|uniref:Uncharacterized protein n=1 Tax=Cercospora zeae-maydis SCOH1-5 TaxID=717836 RepID=A0A6A6F4Y3_9PEZI|nr:hypothetical protein CERZMDRAFT_91805 [Cercospora zeae-maydis SCOH1-5]